MISAAHRQEALSLAYIQAVAASCGMTTSKPSHDYGIDITLHEVASTNDGFSESSFRLDIQAKSTTRWSLGSGYVKYELEVRAYNALCVRRLMVPRILVLLALPKDESDWLLWSPEELKLRQCAYWCSFHGGDERLNRKSVVVAIPTIQPFSPDELRKIMELVRGGKRLPPPEFH